MLVPSRSRTKRTLMTVPASLATRSETRDRFVH
jgi:hypothetical protein